jgi:hypothetical protein
MQKSMRAGVRRIVLAGEASPRQPSVEEHANALLAWLRSDPHLPGHYVPVADLKRAYLAFCRSQKWRAHKWNVIGRCVRELTGGGRPYRTVAGKRVRVYWVPSHPVEVIPREWGI